MDSLPRVALLMGSQSDWDVLRSASEILAQFNIPHECRALSAHRTPNQVVDYIRQAEAKGVKIFIVGAGHAAHLAGAVAAQTTLPVLGVPIDSSCLKGIDALLSTVQMPGGIPVATMAIGKSGAKNAGLFACAILATSDSALANQLSDYRTKMTQDVVASSVIPSVPFV